MGPDRGPAGYVAPGYLPCRDEASVFAHLGAGFVEPAERSWDTLCRAAKLDPADPALHRESTP